MDYNEAQHWLKEHYPEIIVGETFKIMMMEFAEDYHAKRMGEVPSATNDTQAGYLELELSQAKEETKGLSISEIISGLQSLIHPNSSLIKREDVEAFILELSNPNRAIDFATPTEEQLERKRLWKKANAEASFKDLVSLYFEIEHQIRKKL